MIGSLVEYICYKTSDYFFKGEIVHVHIVDKESSQCSPTGNFSSFTFDFSNNRLIDTDGDPVLVRLTITDAYTKTEAFKVLNLVTKQEYRIMKLKRLEKI